MKNLVTLCFFFFLQSGFSAQAQDFVRLNLPYAISIEMPRHLEISASDINAKIQIAANYENNENYTEEKPVGRIITLLSAIDRDIGYSIALYVAPLQGFSQARLWRLTDKNMVEFAREITGKFKEKTKPNAPKEIHVKVSKLKGEKVLAIFWGESENGNLYNSGKNTLYITPWQDYIVGVKFFYSGNRVQLFDKTSSRMIDSLIFSEN